MLGIKYFNLKENVFIFANAIYEVWLRKQTDLSLECMLQVGIRTVAKTIGMNKESVHNKYEKSLQKNSRTFAAA